MCTMLGMAFGGWMSGKIFDLTGCYHAAFMNGIGWNLLNLTIATLKLRRVRKHRVSLQPRMSAAETAIFITQLTQDSAACSA